MPAKESTPYPLPIDPFLPELVEQFRTHSGLVIEAAPGAGKTTRFPRAVLEAGLAGSKQVWATEPRRLAVRMAARRVAAELKEPLGKRVGYSIRFENVGGTDVPLRFVTEGILLRRLSSSPSLEDIGVVILDEFHERHLETDALLACLLRLQQTSRPELKLAVMSATVDGAGVAEHLRCPCIECEGRLFPVDTHFAEAADARPIQVRVAETITSIVQDGVPGDVLTFLPGLGEIARVEEVLAAKPFRDSITLRRLHGSLNSREQDAVMAPADRRKIVLATNVAESSVTIEGIGIVVDSGLVKEPGYSAWSGLAALETRPISQASAVQRAGRAGRTARGACYRLYTRTEFQRMAPFSVPELQRADLCGLVLLLKGQGIEDAQALPWLAAPSGDALAAAHELLTRLGAVGPEGALTNLGRRMLAYPCHPRIARLLCEAEDRNFRHAGALLAAILEHPDPRPSRRWEGRRSDRLHQINHDSDPALLAENILEGRIRTGTVHQILKQARHYYPNLQQETARREMRRRDCLRLFLAGFPDRVARRLRAGGREFMLASGGSIRQAEESEVLDAELVVALEARKSHGGRAQTYLIRASALEPDWLLDLPGENIRITREVHWDANRERATIRERMLYGNLVLEETETDGTGQSGVKEVLFEEAMKEGLARFFGGSAWDRFRGRCRFLAFVRPELQVPDESDARTLLQDSCERVSSFKELEQANLFSAIQFQSGPELPRALRELAPESVKLPGGQTVQIEYPEKQPPWAAARIQAFYGMKEGPRVGGGQVPVRLHLLAPNQRPAQITDDLAGFWSGSYERVRKELKGRYPKHYWPDDPASAEPVQLRRQVKARPGP